MKNICLFFVVIIFLSSCTVVKNAGVESCAKHQCSVKKGLARNSYGRACGTHEGDLRKIGRCGGCTISYNPFKRVSYIKYCPMCQKDYKDQVKNRKCRKRLE